MDPDDLDAMAAIYPLADLDIGGGFGYETAERVEEWNSFSAQIFGPWHGLHDDPPEAPQSCIPVFEVAAAPVSVALQRRLPVQKPLALKRRSGPFMS